MLETGVAGVMARYHARRLAMSISIRPVAPADVSPCATVCDEAFREIAEPHGFSPDVPAPDVVTPRFTHNAGRGRE